MRPNLWRARLVIPLIFLEPSDLRRSVPSRVCLSSAGEGGSKVTGEKLQEVFSAKCKKVFTAPKSLGFGVFALLVGRFPPVETTLAQLVSNLIALSFGL